MGQGRLRGKVAVITGGAGGIGRATARSMVAEGAKVVIADLDERGAQALAEELGSEVAVAVKVDVTSMADTERMVAEAEAHFGRLDVVACNAGQARFPKPATQVSEEEFDRILEVNVKGPWLCARAAVPALRRAGGGSVVITGSVMGERARPGFAAYASSKAAANHLARTLALELAVDGIRVNAVAPVATDTPMLPQFLGPDDPEGARQRFVAGIPLGRLAQPEDIAEAITYLAGDGARFITGIVLPVDGGRSI